VAAIVKILKDIGRPFYLGCASGIALLRLGALSLPNPSGSGPTMAFDRDLDFAVFSSDDADRSALKEQLQQRCVEAGIFDDCTSWFRITPRASPQNNIKHADFYDLRTIDVGAFAGKMKVCKLRPAGSVMDHRSGCADAIPTSKVLRHWHSSATPGRSVLLRGDAFHTI